MISNRILFVALLIPILAVMGCTGDDGPAGPPGADGTATCLECHNTQVQQDIAIQYTRSQHALGEFVDYAGTRDSCARCHSGGGFVEFVLTGEVQAGDINDAGPISCQHCHSVHTEFEVTDYALRTTARVPWIADAGFGDTSADYGTNANICANCHQSRRNEPNITNPGATFEITSTHYGPHHGAQANVFAGTLWAEIPGSTAYPTTSLHLSQGADCLTCHMGDYSSDAGGHTWWPSLDACQGCHATASFDYNGFQTNIQTKLDTLRDLLIGEGAVEWVVVDEAYEPVVGFYDMVVAQAFFNWIGLTEDRSKGVHNPRYIEALIDNSIEALEARLP
jgi:hypothetical protein